ncbi:MAG: hypothetical protein Q8S33_31520 [Myxococcales bacterium]|nr:hypothetical protein [Myxococcales bacterium]
MTTEVHQQPQPPVDDSPVDDAHVADPNRERLPAQLNTWLNLPPAELELHAASFMRALETTVIPLEERASVAGALLDLLESERFGSSTLDGRSLRGVAVETVLRIGYPWALQLDPDDLTAAREEVRRLRPLASWRRVGVAVAVIAAVAASLAGVLSVFRMREAPPGPQPIIVSPPVSKVMPPPLTSPLLAPVPANETAVHVAALRAEGLTGLALAVGEACVVGYEQPRPCVQEVTRLAQDLAERSNDEFDVYRAKQWARLVEEPSPMRLREQARFLFENEFARDASFLGPSSVQDTRALMRLVEQASQYEAKGLARPLETLTNDCASKGGQLGIICRDFRERARRMIDATHTFEQTRAAPVRPDNENEPIRRIIDLSLQDRIDDAIDEAALCVATNSRRSADCRAVLADLYDRRYRDRGVEADKQAAERWRTRPSR